MTSFNPPKTRANIEADLTLARQNSDFATEAACLIALGDMAKENEEYNLAQGLYGQAWAAYEKVGDHRQTVQAILSLTDVFIRLSWDEVNFEAAFLAPILCNRALKVAEEAQDFAVQGRVWKVKADLISFDFENREIKQATYEHALKLCELGCDVVGQADAMMQLGIGYLMERQADSYQQAEARFSNALHLYRKADCREGEASALVRLAEVSGSLKDITAKKSYYKQALKLYQQLEQPLEVAKILDELGEIGLREKDYDLAIQYHKKELALCDRYGEDLIGYTSALFSLARVYQAAKNYEEARFYYAKELALCNVTDTMVLASRLFALGRVYALMGDTNTGRQYAQQAIKTSDDNPQRDELDYYLWYRWEWGKIEYEAGYQEAGCALCYEAYKFAEDIPFGRQFLDKLQQELAAMNCPTPSDSETPTHDD